MKTLLLDINTWDLTIDAFGNMAVAEDGYQLAQDVASSIRLFKGEQYYQSEQGIPYRNILGKQAPLNLLKSLMEKQAKTVVGVSNVRVIFNSFSDRKLTGRILFTGPAGEENGITF